MTEPKVRNPLLVGFSPARKFARALALRGGQQSLTRFGLETEPYCDNPVRVVMSERSGAGDRGIEVFMNAPCRKCEKCLRFRQMRWRQRAIAECGLAKRTWMLTLTFSPIHLAGTLARAKSPDLKDVERSAYGEVQKFLKRLRKAVPRSKVRYLAIYERGEESGRSHYHLLLHEVGERPVTKAVLERQWPSHVHARLVDTSSGHAAGYVTKYLTKSIDISPRASNGYGRAPTRS